MSVAARKRRWWVRAPLFVVWMVFVYVGGFILFETHPTISLGHNVGGLAEEDKIAVLALIDQVKTNQFMPDGDPFVINSGHIPNGWLDRYCRENPVSVTAAMSGSIVGLGYRVKPIRCHDDTGYFFHTKDEDGEYAAGYLCGSWCGGGTIYRVIHLGSVIVLWRSGGIHF